MQETYEQIYEAFIKYAASRGQSDWNELWILCRRRMGCLIASKCEGVSNENIDQISDEAVIEIMGKMQTASDIDSAWISSRFWYAHLHALDKFYRALRKESRLKQYIKDLNEKRIIPNNFSNSLR